MYLVMKKNLLLSGLLLLSVISAEANLSAFFSYCTFNVPGDKPYVETYLNITGTTAQLKVNSIGKKDATIEVQAVFKSGDQIVHFDKYNLHSPEFASDETVIPDFVDQQRVALPNGKYTLELTITDKNANQKAYKIQQAIEVNFPSDKVSMSEIELLESYSKSEQKGAFTKSGYDLIPMVNAFYPKEINSIKFYAEIYNSKLLSQDILVRYFISNKDNNRLVENLFSNVKQQSQEANVLMAELPIDGLPSGNYDLNIEVRSRDNKVIAYKQVFFQRSNAQKRVLPATDLANVDIANSFVTLITNPDTLKEYIHYLYPISSQLEEDIQNNQVETGDLISMQKYFLSFWSKVDNDHPDVAWNNYKEEVISVNATYKTQNKRGYETDRGRVYLQYGPPNSISNSNDDPDSYPYEIWQYYTLKSREVSQTNRKFVFYTTDRSTNDYRLLHSDARGELQDNAWELKLHSRSQQFGTDIDAEQSIDVYGSRTKENFSNPR